MLIVSRRVGEALLIDGSIEIELLDITGGRARLGITAPSAVRVLRRELVQAAEANRDAVSESASQGVQALLGKLSQKKDSSPAAPRREEH